jgi:membrane-associated phospholipid phosphatase
MRIPPWIVVATMIVAAPPPSRVFAQDAAPPPDTVSTPSPSPQNATEAQQPAAVGEEGTKPTRGFLSSLVHNLGDDFRHMPRKNSLYWLAGGGALALAVHSEDNKINAHLIGEDRLWTPGKYIGSTELLLPAAFATYLVGRRTGRNRVQHLGMDEIEAFLISEGIAQSVKLAVRRPRPPELDGTQSHTYSFPSGHATLTFAAATVLQQHLGYRAAIPTYLVASYVAMSRLHDNRHYASDVIFGAATGIMIGRSVTWHGRNFYASPMLVPGGGGIMIAAR